MIFISCSDVKQLLKWLNKQVYDLDFGVGARYEELTGFLFRPRSSIG